MMICKENEMMAADTGNHGKENSNIERNFYLPCQMRRTGNFHL